MALKRGAALMPILVMSSLTLHSPAKINLMLSVHPRRADGFHALTSIVAPLDFGDTLEVRLVEGAVSRLTCDDPAVPLTGDNLILKAAVLFAEKLNRELAFEFDLKKRIPMGAGLGGGSSNGATALIAMNQLSGEPFSPTVLRELAAELGSDCPMFIEACPALMTGRGEHIEPLAASLCERLRGQRVVLFRPDFSVNTAWAYGRLISAGEALYESPDVAAARVEDFSLSNSFESLLFNSFEAPIGQKYLALSTLLQQLREAGQLCLMSGSGSCCFALLEDEEYSESLQRTCREAWGDAIFLVETSIT